MPDAWNPLRLTTHGPPARPVAVLILLLFAAGSLYTALHHEPWRDEADAWLAARDLPLAEMVPVWTAHAGTPVLWYLVLKPLACAGLPYRSQTVANLLFVWAAAAVLVFAAPLTTLTKSLLLGSYFFSYEYAVIARPYALAILLLFLALSLRRRPLPFALVIALLLSTNVHGAILGVLLVGAVRPRGWQPFAIMVGGAFLAWWQLHLPAGQSNPLVAAGLRWEAPLAALRDGFTPMSTSFWTALTGGLEIVALGLALRRSRPALLFLIAAVAALLMLYAAVWFGGLRASGMILIAAVTAIWIAADVPVTTISRAAALALNLMLLVSALFALQVARMDIGYAFSGSREMAGFIDHRFDGHDIAAHNFFSAEALLPYLPQHRFWYVGLGEYGTYLKWNEAMREGATMSYESAVTLARSHFSGSRRPWLLLLNAKMPTPERLGFRLLHAPSVVVFRNLDERFWLYEPLATAGGASGLSVDRETEQGIDFPHPRRRKWRETASNSGL